MTYKKKLIEVALPLDAINKASTREKSIRRGHPSGLHLWWARRPLAACRAVLFASLVDDPSGHPEVFPTEESQREERDRLFRLIEQLVTWENSNNASLLLTASREIHRWNDEPPPVLDPFCGGGSIPLEAQRLGLRAVGEDLNPVAVLITKALAEVPALFAGRAPVSPSGDSTMQLDGAWDRASGLAHDVLSYGTRLREIAKTTLGHLYPPLRDESEEYRPIAWLWARTVRCPNPACAGEMPLVRSFWLSTKPHKRTWVEPVVDRKSRTVSFRISKGDGEAPDGTITRQGGTCLICSAPVPFDHMRVEAKAGRMGQRLMAMVGEAERGRVYLSPSPDHESIAMSAQPLDPPQADLPPQALGFRVQSYGMSRYSDLFTGRQLTALTTFGDLVPEIRKIVIDDALKAGFDDDPTPLAERGTGAQAYGDAIALYLSLAISRMADYSSTICTWASNPQMEIVRGTFARQALPMTWDFAEANIFGPSTGSFEILLDWVRKVLEELPTTSSADVHQLDATRALETPAPPMIATDPPYYDNIGYADLSDFFYVWLRRSLGSVYPGLFSTLLTPKQSELIASPFRHSGDRSQADHFFEEGLRSAFVKMREAHHPEYPLTLFYAFRQTESVESSTEGPAFSSTGWETMLQGLIDAGFSITGTWPVRTERTGRSVSIGTNALASSIVLVCRPREDDAPLATRREFGVLLRDELPEALRLLQLGNIAPVDLAQAAIGPGMAVFSRFSRVLEADGSPMRVRAALELVNQVLSEVLSHLEDEFDSPTRWAIGWFEQYASKEGAYGEAEVLARAKGVAINGLVQDGLVTSGRGKVRLLAPGELPVDWDPMNDERLRVWEVTHHLVRALADGGEAAAAELLRKVGSSYGDLARDLAYRLFNTCERKKWSQEARGYNELVVAWPEIQRISGQGEGAQQQTLG
jgi:putative DNA methylase